ncbi:amino acid adenylation domain-containing protein [Kitasatospora sp. NPDC054795]
MTTSLEGSNRISGDERRVPADSVLHLVREQARLRPHAPAVRSPAGVLTYGRLWHRVLVVAAALHEAGVGPGDRVALWADRTAEVVGGALAVLALRAAYVPVDPTHPGERVAAVIAGSDPAALLHDHADPAALPALPGRPVIDLREIADRPEPPEHELPRPEDIAYVIFTSGSTGAPKGVLIEHGSLVNYAAWAGSLVGAEGSGSPLFASLGFDLSMTSFWVPLCQGRPLVTVAGLWDQETIFGPGQEPYGFIKLTPSHARFFEFLAEPPDYRRATRTLMFGGEGLDPELLRSLGDRLDGVRLVNHYGPTETTVGCCAHVFDRTRIPDLPTVPIGRPVWNSRAYVVDEGLRPVRPGDPGELVIAGRAVAAGYLGRDRDERFVDECELGGAAGRAYRTGDLVELRPDGSLLYLGRRDQQLKIAGHRVELGELRHHVLAVPGVADVAFEVVRGPVDTLAAFLLPKSPQSDGDAFAETVRSALAASLPSPLVPGELHCVPEIVFNANGKCDVAATRRLLDLDGPEGGAFG